MSMNGGSGTLVQIWVPQELVLEIYWLIGNRTGSGRSDEKARHENNATNGLPDDWSVSLVRRMYQESPKNMRAILDTLASRRDETVTATELVAVLSESRGDDANSSTLAGTLGAFGRRVKNRYRQSNWPFDAQWSEENGQAQYRMSAPVAALLKSAE